MLVVGVTGRIGSGKSRLCQALSSRHGCHVIDADELGHEALRSPDIRDSVRRRFGPGILDSRGDVDRGRLGAIVFADAGALRDLEAIVHPWILRAIDAHVVELRARGGVGIVLIDAALLMSWRGRLPLDRIVWVRASDDAALERLRQRGIPAEEARRRLAFQLPDEEFESAADLIVSNDGSLEDLDDEAERLWAKLRDADHRRIQE